VAVVFSSIIWENGKTAMSKSYLLKVLVKLIRKNEYIIFVHEPGHYSLIVTFIDIILVIPLVEFQGRIPSLLLVNNFSCHVTSCTVVFKLIAYSLLR
jgi:hypothetical protein